MLEYYLLDIMHDKNTIHGLIREFYPYAKKKLGFKESCKVFLRENKENYSDPLGKTAYYDPQGMEIHLYSTGRHPKDVLRSFSHELVHHNQNCQGNFDGGAPTTEGYAQEDEHLRKMEKQAYLEGNILLRDWCDLKNAKNQGIEKHRGEAPRPGSIPLRNNDSEEWLGPAGNHSANYTKGNRSAS